MQVVRMDGLLSTVLEAPDEEIGITYRDEPTTMVLAIRPLGAEDDLLAHHTEVCWPMTEAE